MLAMALPSPAPIGSAPLRPVRRATPEPTADQVLIRVEACAVCRTDLQLVEGEIAGAVAGVVPGHQVVGRVIARGPQATARTPGQRVGAFWLAFSCGRCPMCVRGNENLCPTARFTGMHVDGGYAECMVARSPWLVPLPEEIDPVTLAPLLCAGVIGMRSLRLSGVGPGGRLGLFGFGASARCVLQTALAQGIEVHVCTRSETDRQRALALGATWVGPFDARPPVALDGAITFAPVGEAIIHALAAIRPGGTVAVNAIHLDRVPAFDYGLLWGERCLRSVANVTRADATEFLGAARDIGLHTDTETHPLSDANLALARLARGQVHGSAVLVP